MKAKSIEDAQNTSKIFFEEYKKNHNYSSLESALDMDNTSLSNIFLESIVGFFLFILDIYLKEYNDEQP